MRALLPLLLLPLLLLPGCYSFDGLILAGETLDAYDPPVDRIPEANLEWVQFPSLDGTELWGVWAHQDDADAPVIVDFHGNGGPIGDEWGRFEEHWSWGYEVFTFDYRGYGRSEGEPTRDGVLEEDGQAAVTYVADTTGLAPEELRWIALSLGGAVAIHTADEVRPKALVLESTFASPDQLADEGTSLDLPPGWFFVGDYDNEAAIREILPPVYVIHGLQDDYVAPTHGDTLYAAAPDNPKWLWHPEGVAHSDIHEVIPAEYRARVTAFLETPDDDPNAAGDAGAD